MSCRVDPATIRPDRDPQQIHRYAVSRWVETPVQITDATGEWRDGDGLTLHPNGPHPVLTMPAPAALGPASDTVAEIELTTAQPLRLDVGWTDDHRDLGRLFDDAATTAVAAGHQVLRVDLGDRLHAAPSRIALRLDGAGEPTVIHAVRAGASTATAAPAEGRSATLIDATTVPPFIAEHDLRRRQAPGTGLVLETHPDPDLYVPYFALAFDRDAGEHRYLLLDSPDATAASIYFTATACGQFSEQCRASLRPLAPGVLGLDLGSVSNWHGRIGALRVDLGAPPGTAVHLAGLRFVSRTEFLELRAQHEEQATLVGPGHTPVILHADQLRVLPQRLGPLKLRFTRPRHDGPYIPSLVFTVDRLADDVPFLVLEGDDLPPEAVPIYFTSDACPTFSERCRATLKRTGPHGFAADLSRVDGWDGRIGALRVDLTRPDAGHARITQLSFPPALGAANIAEPERPAFRRGTFGLSRLADGRRGWEVRAGRRLDCRFAAEPPPELPTAVDVRVPPGGSGIEFVEVAFEWRDAAGRAWPAGRWRDTSTQPRSEHWHGVTLTPPPAPVTTLGAIVTCNQNCTSLAEPSRGVEIAQPEYRRAAVAPAPPNLILISIDTLRADHLSTYGYARATDPFLARWARGATVYDELYAVDTWTTPTHATVFTGLLPTFFEPLTYRYLPLEQETLAETLAARGYATVAAVDGILLDPRNGLDQGFDRYESRFEPFETKRDAFVAAVTAATASGAPVFGFLHTYAVHGPYSVPPGPTFDDFLAHAARGTTPTNPLWLTDLPSFPGFAVARATAVAHLVGLYDAGIAQVDHELEALLSDPRMAPVLQNAVVAITSDHGEAFMEHGVLGHGLHFPYRELLHVPLLIRTPGQSAGRRDPTLHSQTEVRGLVLEAMGLSPAPPAAPCAQPGIVPAAIVGGGPAEAPHGRFRTVTAIAHDWQLLRVTERGTGRIEREEFVPREPGSGTAPADDLAARLRTTTDCLDRIMRGERRASVAPVPAVGRDERARLRALGYVTE